jgi:CRISPR-associated protein (TIGR02710 family)
MMTFYEGWDAFKHRDAVTSLRQSQVIRRLSALATGAEDTTLQNLAASADEGRQFVDDLLKDSGGGKHPSSRMTSDLLANAHRRAAEGRFDDGVARLYRAVEMAAQARLWERYRLSTENVDETRVPRTARQAVEERLGAPPWENLGLDKSYTLLNALEDSLGQRFYEREGRLKSTLFARNHSILAHGVDPISAETCEVFRSLALDLLELSEADLPRFPLWPEEPEWLR